ncbi:hypothetical protein [Natrinema sp. SYSU A 869]|uniref:hypothetical protein n=1 Tax=Natrinema sp. SYSU A 869 TaxID=2871694 RepID=UPI001CA43F90|nr:hypothetical protein [Natrinema sp. SYSU A 869]
MSTSRLGQSENLEKFWSEQLLDQPNAKIHINSVSKDTIRSFPEVEEYPYEGQIKLFGSLEYEIPGRGDNSFIRSGNYEYRSASGLFLLNSQTDRPRPSEVFSEINQLVSNSAEIEDYLSLNREDLWRFLEDANSIEKLVVRGPKGEYDATLLAEILQRENPKKELAQAELTHKEKQSLNAVLDQISIPDEFDNIHDLDIDWYDTVIDQIEATYCYDGYFSTIIFKRGSIKIDAETDNSREYLLQLFEREVVQTQV